MRIEFLCKCFLKTLILKDFTGMICTKPQPKRYMFFLSYRSDEIDIIRQVADWLMANQVSFWMDEYCVRHRHQEVFQEEIYKGIDRSEYFVCFLSKNYFNSPYCLIELERALKKFPIEKFTFICLEQDWEELEKKFLEFYPELSEHKKLINPVTKDLFRIIEFFNKKLNLNAQLPNFVSGLESDYWHIVEAGFKIKTYLEPHFSSRFQHISRIEHNLLTGRHRDSYIRFIDPKDANLELLFDYEIYQSDHAEGLHYTDLRPTDPKKETRERQRLKEEMALYESEVKKAVEQFASSRNGLKLCDLDNEKVEEVGIHMLSTMDRNISYKHRMYTFRVSPWERTFRMVKLVLPHPNKEKVVITIRFIFSYEGNQVKFFEKVFLLNEIVKSFDWIEESSSGVLDLSFIKKAPKIFGK